MLAHPVEEIIPCRLKGRFFDAMKGGQMTTEQRLLLVLESIRDELRRIREAIEPGEHEENEEDS